VEVGIFSGAVLSVTRMGMEETAAGMPAGM
jgi:hypothetical protein